MRYSIHKNILIVLTIIIFIYTTVLSLYTSNINFVDDASAQGSAHPFLLVTPDQFQELQSRSSQEPWLGMKNRAISECTQRVMPDSTNGSCNGSLNTNIFPNLSSNTFCMRAIVSSCALAYIVDPVNKGTYLSKFVSTLPHWEEIISVQSGASHPDGIRNWSNQYYNNATAAAFNTTLAMDILYEDLMATPHLDSRYAHQLEYAEFLMQQEFNHFYGITKPVHDFYLDDGSTLSYHAPSRHPPAKEAWMIMWKMYKRDFNPDDNDSQALLFGGMLNNAYPDLNGNAKNTEGYLPEISARINESGVYTEGSSYAHAGWGLDRDERSHLFDIFEFTGKNNEFGIDFYSNLRYQAFYEWLYGYASTPFGVMTSFGDTYAFRQLIDVGHGSNSWATSSHIGQAGKFSQKAGEYALWKSRDRLQQGRLLNYLLLGPIATISTPPSRVFNNGGGFFLEYPANDYSLYGALWNVREPSEGSPVFHVRKDVNAIYVAGYGAPLLMNGGFCGSSSPSGPDSCFGTDENGVGYRFSGVYLGSRAVSNNVALINYNLGSNYLEPDNDTQVSNFGSGVVEGFVGFGLDYVAGSTANALSNGTHNRSFIFVHPTDNSRGYFLLFDEFLEVSNGPVHLAFHPNTSSRQTIDSLKEYDLPVGRRLYSDQTTGLTLFFATEPESISFHRGIIATAGSVGAFVPEYFLNTYSTGEQDNKQIASVLFPYNSQNPKALMTRITNDTYSGTVLDHGESLIDIALESSSEVQQTHDGTVFQAKAVFYRLQNDNLIQYFIRLGKTFLNNSQPVIGVTAEKHISVYLNETQGNIVSPGTEVTFYHPGITGVIVNRNMHLPVLDSGIGWVKVYIEQGTHELYLVSSDAQTPIPGDANEDGKVDGLDYVIWLNNYGTTTTLKHKAGDFDGNGKVDGLDYVIWLNNYGK